MSDGMDGGLLEWVDRARRADSGATLAVPITARLLSDQLTPVIAYRRLVSPDARESASFLLESVEQGDRLGRYSLMGARPVVEVWARGHAVELSDRRVGLVQRSWVDDDPLLVMRGLTRDVVLVRPPMTRLPDCPLGGWFGWASYDTVRYAERERLAPERAPADDRGLPDLHWGLYDGVVAFDHVGKVIDVVRLAFVRPGEEAGPALARAREDMDAVVELIDRPERSFRSGRVGLVGVGGQPGGIAARSNLTQPAFEGMVGRAKDYIRAGDIFQVVLGQRIERESSADPFDVYRALRAVNPSPYMVYMQGRGCILAASSPEILCRVRRDAEGRLVLTNRPLAGTRRRGATAEEDAALEAELRADPKERAEHVMLVDLGRNDVGQVAEPGSVRIERIMDVERYSHVMHLSSTVTGVLREGLDAWDALRATLPVGTISGAPKLRAMQIIDELEPHRRGPYGGGMGYAGLDGQMDIALALRTMVIPTAGAAGLDDAAAGARRWVYHLQAAAGIVADSDPSAEYRETVAKAEALVRAVELAERAFGAGA